MKINQICALFLVCVQIICLRPVAYADGRDVNRETIKSISKSDVKTDKTEPVLETVSANSGENKQGAEPVAAAKTSQTPLANRRSRVEKSIIPAGLGGEVVLGKAKVIIPPGALEADTEISISELYAVAETGEDLKNVTGNAVGYRFLPEGTRFKSEVIIELPYKSELESKPASLDVTETYYYDTAASQWKALPREGIDRENGVIISRTAHFTDMINGTLTLPETAGPIDININSIKGLEAANPSSGVAQIEGLEAAGDGSAGFRIKVESPAGRGGMTPEVAISYNSGGGRGIMGRGFDFSGGVEVRIDTRYGAARYDEKDKYILEGEKLEKAGNRNSNEIIYRSLREKGFKTITHYINGNYWEVKEGDGRVKVYGKDDNSFGGDSNHKDIWKLNSETDRYGNKIEYFYAKDDSNYAALSEISYSGGHYKIRFEYSRDIRPDVIVDAHGGYAQEIRHRLNKITVSGGDEVIRQYVINYTDNTQEIARASVVQSIACQTGGGEENWKYGFEYNRVGEENGKPKYFDDARRWNDNPLQVTSGVNGGSQMSMSMGGGIGVGPPAATVDGRFTGGVTTSFNKGETNSEVLSVDINGDGIVDTVRQSGGDLIIEVNQKNGGSYTVTKAIPGLALYDIEREVSKTSSKGWTTHGGVGMVVASVGVSYGQTKQSGSTSVEVGIMDLDGDGLSDIAVSGRGTYFKNTSDANGINFEERNITASGIPSTTGEVLTAEEITEYDKQFYIQRPFRAWKAPYKGNVTVEENIQNTAGTPVSVTGRTYKGDRENNSLRVKTVEKPSGSAAYNVIPNEMLYYVPDVGNEREIKENKTDWNIKIRYNTVDILKQYEDLFFYFVPDTVSVEEYEEAAEVLSAYFEAVKDESAGSAVIDHYERKSKDELTGGIKDWLIDNGYYIVKTIKSEYFEQIVGGLNESDALRFISLYEYESGRDEYRVTTQFNGAIIENNKQVVYDVLKDNNLIGINNPFGLEMYRIFDIVPKHRDGGLVYTEENTKGITEYRTGTVQSRSGKRDVIILGQYDNKLSEARKSGDTWSLYFDDVFAGGVTVDFGEEDEENDKVIITKDDDAAIITWELSNKRDIAGAMEGWELDRVWKKDYEDKRFITNVDNALQDYKAEEELKEIIAQFIDAGAIEWTAFISKLSIENTNSVPRKYKKTNDGVNDQIKQWAMRSFKENYFDYNNYSDGENEAARSAFLEAVPLYTLQEGKYKTAVLDAIPDYLDSDILKMVTEENGLIKFENISTTLELRNNYSFAVTVDGNTATVNRYAVNTEGVIFIKKENIKLLWDAATDFSAINKAAAELTTSSNNKVIPNSADILYGGVNNWYYGIWIGREGFSEANLKSSFTNAISVAEGKDYDGYDPETDPQYNDPDLIEQKIKDPPENTTRYYYKVMQNNTNNTQTPEIVKDAETGNASPDILIGEVSGVLKNITSWDNAGSRQTVAETEYYFPYIEGSTFHISRSGGDSFYNVPGIIQQSPQGAGMGLPAIRKSKSSGTDKSKSFDAEIKVSGDGGSVSRNVGHNDTEARMVQNIQDMNGDGIPDIVVAGGNTTVIYGAVVNNTVQYGNDVRTYGNLGDLSFNTSNVDSEGGGISASGGVSTGVSASGRIKVTGSFSPSMSTTSGAGFQSAGFIDINGDGLPDYKSGNSLLLNTGYKYEEYTYQNGNALPPANISESKTGSESSALGVGAGGSADTGGSSAMVNAGINAGVNFSASKSNTTQMFLDINGDGLADVVRKTDGGTFAVAYNTGKGFLAEEELNIGQWSGEYNGDTARSNYGNHSDGNLSGGIFANTPFVGGIIGRFERTSNLYGADLANLINNLDFSSTLSFGLNGGANVGGSVNIMIWPAPPITVDINASGSMGINGGVSLTGVTVRMTDMNGDGLVDQVLRIPNYGTFVKLNLAGEAGLLKKIKLPQGGTYELAYERAGNTPDMPQNRYVLASVTKDDKESGIGEHRYTVNYQYENGYYDRINREFYGFDTVRTINADGSEIEAAYDVMHRYHLKGVELGRTIRGSSNDVYTVTNNTPDAAPYARVIESENIVYDVKNGNNIKNIVTYDFDEYWNVTRYRDNGDYDITGDEVSADIQYSANESKHIYNLPAKIEVLDSAGNIIRKRTADYNSNGSLVAMQEYTGSGRSLEHSYTYDDYGNILSVTDAAGVSLQYVYDTTVHQYIKEIKQVGTDGTTYTGKMRWNIRTGLKENETDVNNNSIRYEYDEFLRTKKIFTSYDTITPAVLYEYYKPANGRRYAVTKNKVTFDPADSTTIDTVVEIDGLGRARRTAKTGARYNPASKVIEHGWNVSGALVYDEKARPVREGQTYFVQGESVNNFLASALQFNRVTVKTYDVLDRIITTTLPDNSVMRNEYGIKTLNGQKLNYTLAVDPLLNKSVRYTDVRQNIVRVEKLDRNNKLLTSASYQYNAIGEMLKAFDAAGNPLTINYDMLGRKLSLETKDSGRQEWTYNDKGQLEYETNSQLRKEGKRINYEYDGFNRVKKIDYPYCEDTVYEYGLPQETGSRNIVGRIKKLTDKSGTVEYEYGALGEVVTEKRTLKQSSGNTKTRTAVMGYQADYLGRMQYIDYPDGERITYGYDYGGNVNSVTGHKQQNGLSGTYPYIKDIGYDEYGQRTYIKYGNNVETTYVYDANRRWLSSINTKSNYGTLQNISYSFDKVGNVLGYTNTSGNYSTSQNYSYDDLYQLTKAVGTTNGSTISNQSYTASYTQKFSFDTQGLGNMTKKESSQGGNRSFVIGSDLNYTYDYVYEPGFVHRAKRIGENYYRYDLNGNVTAVQGTPFNAAQSQDREVTQLDDNTYTTDYGWGLEEDGFGRASSDAKKKLGRTYTWNEKNELSGSADSKYNVSYVYGEGGERAAKVAHSSTGTATETLYFNRMYSWHYDGAISDYTGNYSKNIFLGETRILTKVNRADTFTAEEYAKQYWYHSDHLGSASLITDYQGKEYERIEYTPYGELWVERKTPVDNLDTLFRFTGKELDAETGNYYYGARYLDPRTSRWLSTDPAIGEYVPSAPVNDDVRKRNGNLPGMGGVFNVVNFHLYHYAGNNPVKYTDPDGRETLTSETTQEEFNKSFFAQHTNLKWETTQEFFKENPNGAYYRHDDETQWKTYENKNDIKVINPESANTDILMLVTGGSFIKGAIKASILKPTTHGAKRIAGSAATRGGVLSRSEIALTKLFGKTKTANNGTTAHILQIGKGKYNYIVIGDNGKYVTSFKHISEKALKRLSKNYGIE